MSPEERTLLNAVAAAACSAEGTDCANGGSADFAGTCSFCRAAAKAAIKATNVEVRQAEREREACARYVESLPALATEWRAVIAKGIRARGQEEKTDE